MLGPNGMGAIYRIDLDNGLIEHWATVPSTGSDPHDPPDAWPDTAAGDAVGTRGLGDIDISLPDRTLPVSAWPHAPRLALAHVRA